MSTATAPAADRVQARAELVATLRELCARLPVPDASWHPHVDAIVACRHDFEDALALAEADDAAVDLLASLLEGDVEAAFDTGASPQLLAAWERLEALPVPEGRHPFLDEIVPTLEALRLLLVALSHGPR